jgi:exodeoxyribonuclease-3
MRIATWNVNSIKTRLPHVTAWLATHKPDVLMLQELKGLDFPADAFTAAGYKSAAVTQKSYNGVALLSPYDIHVILDKLPGDDADEQARYLEADINNIRVINIYLPNGNPVDSEKYPYKLRWMQRLRTRLETLRNDRVPFLVGGDFNVIPDARDCFDPKAWKGDALFLPQTRAEFRALLNLGLTDALRVVNGADKQYTYWDYQYNAWPANKGIRIDHFLLSPALTDRLAHCTVDREERGREQPSDHTPVIVEIVA